MEKPAPDPKKLLQSWMEWERGEVTPGRVMANLKTGGLRELLEDLVAATSVGFCPVRGSGRRSSGSQCGECNCRARRWAGRGRGPEETEPSPPPNDSLGGQPATWAPVV